MNKIKKTISALLVSASVFSVAQVTIGVKTNLLFQTDQPSWSNVSSGAITAYNDNGSNNVGFNVGLSAKMDLPMGLFFQPEIYYTTFKKDFTIPALNSSSTSTEVSVKNNRVDVPVLVGYNVLGKTLGIFAGPVGSFNLSTENQWKDFKENGTKSFTVGYQFGAQLTLSQLVFSARYEGAFSDDERKFISSNVNTGTQEVRYDNRQSLLLFGLGYNF